MSRSTMMSALKAALFAVVIGAAMVGQGAEIEFQTFDANGAGTSYNVDGVGGVSFDLAISSNGNSTVFSFSETADLDGGTVDDTLSFDLVYTVYTNSTYDSANVTLGSSTPLVDNSNSHFGQNYVGDPSANLLYPGDSFTLEVQNLVYVDGEGDSKIAFTGFNSIKKFGNGAEDLLLGTSEYSSLTVPGASGSVIDLGGVKELTLTTSITSGTANQRLRDLNFTFETVRFLWENDMTADPVDDGWVVRNASSSNYTVSAGVLAMDNQTLLDTDPFNELKGTTKVDLEWRSITESAHERGAFLWLNIDGDAPDKYVVRFESHLTNDTQRVQIVGGNTDPVLATHEGFSTNMLTLSATLDAFNETAEYIVTDGIIAVTNSVSLVASANAANNAVTLGTQGPSSEVDYVRIEANARPGEAYLVASDAIAIDLVSPATTVSGSVELEYGTVSTNLEITAIAVSDESHGVGSFNAVTAAPATLDSTGYGTSELEVEFDNGVAGLPYGSATGLVTVTWTETGSGVTNDTVVPVSALYSPVDLVNAWNGAGDGVNWGDEDNWDLDRVPGVLAADSGVIDNGGSVMVATNFTGAYAYDVIVQNSSTLNIAADLKNVDEMNVGTVVDQVATVNQATGAVVSASLDISVAGNASNVVYTLTDGSHDVSGNTTVESNGVLNVDGGSLTAEGSVEVAAGAVLRQTGGSVDAGSGLATTANGFIVRSDGVIEISGGTFRNNSRISFASGGIFRIIGDEATVSQHQFAGGNQGTYEFVLDETGVSTLETTSWAKLAGCTFSIVGTAYTGGPADIVLFSAGSNAGISELGTNYTVTGLGTEGVDWTITELTDPHTVTLNILGNAPIGDITLGGLDASGNLVFSWDTVGGQSYNVETNINLMIPAGWGIYETTIGDGSAVLYTNTPVGPQLFYRVTSD